MFQIIGNWFIELYIFVEYLCDINRKKPSERFNSCVKHNDIIICTYPSSWYDYAPFVGITYLICLFGVLIYILYKLNKSYPSHPILQKRKSKCSASAA